MKKTPKYLGSLIYLQCFAKLLVTMPKTAKAISIVLMIVEICFAYSCTSTKPEDNEIPLDHGKQVYSDTMTIFRSSTEQFKSGQIPERVFQLKNLRHLYIQGMDCDVRHLDEQGNDITKCWMITEIPSQIKNLTQLETIQLNVNAISKIPDERTGLKNLKTVVLDDNSPLSDIENIVELKNLEYLGLNGCHISKLPDNIGQLKKLRSLGLAGNNMNQSEKERTRKALPNCEIYF